MVVRVLPLGRPKTMERRRAVGMELELQVLEHPHFIIRRRRPP
jgi:hypothetical protein